MWSPIHWKWHPNGHWGVLKASLQMKETEFTRDRERENSKSYLWLFYVKKNLTVQFRICSDVKRSYPAIASVPWRFSFMAVKTKKSIFSYLQSFAVTILLEQCLPPMCWFVLFIENNLLAEYSTHLSIESGWTSYTTPNACFDLKTSMNKANPPTWSESNPH